MPALPFTALAKGVWHFAEHIYTWGTPEGRANTIYPFQNPKEWLPDWLHAHCRNKPYTHCHETSMGD